jgi:hypothetical protein
MIGFAGDFRLLQTKQWVRSGVMRGVLEALAEHLRIGGRLDVSGAFIDGSFAPRAQYTSPIPPAPSGDWISYGPSLVPGEESSARTIIVPESCYLGSSHGQTVSWHSLQA